jgi:hypothetical protein
VYTTTSDTSSTTTTESGRTSVIPSTPPA